VESEGKLAPALCTGTAHRRLGADSIDCSGGYWACEM